MPWPNWENYSLVWVNINTEPSDLFLRSSHTDHWCSWCPKEKEKKKKKWHLILYYIILSYYTTKLGNVRLWTVFNSTIRNNILKSHLNWITNHYLIYIYIYKTHFLRSLSLLAKNSLSFVFLLYILAHNENKLKLSF